jgi:hypothetical protein
MHSPPQSESNGWSPSQTVNLVYLVATAHATCLTVFLRDSFGAEALGVPGIAAFLLLFVTVGATGSPDLLFFSLLWFIALIVQRLQTLRNGWCGIHQHSRYAGYPAATRLCCPFVTDERVLQRLEPVLAAVLGGLVLLLWSNDIGQFVLWGAGSLAIRMVLDQFTHHRRLQQLHDAELEQQVLLADWERQRIRRKGTDSWPM